MSPDIVADENISNSIISSLRSAEYKVISIRAEYRGLEDFEIIKIAADKNSVVLTDDRDFGEWIFSHKVQNSGVISLRYEYNDRKRIIEMLLSVWRNIQIRFIISSQLSHLTGLE